MRDQTAVHPPAASSSQSDIISAACDRAAFWKYPTNGPWTVPVSTPTGEVQVSRDQYGTTKVGQPRKAG